MFSKNVWTRRSPGTGEETNMEFLTGLTPEETLELEELLDASRIGTEVRVRGAVHTIRDMGELSFVVLRKRDGLLQCIFEEGTTNYAVKDLREEMAVEISGVLEEDARAPHGIEIRAREVKVFGRPYEAPPLPIGKWKLNTSLEAKLNYRSTALRNVRERAKFRIQEGIVISCTASISQRSTLRRSAARVPRAAPTSSSSIISIVRPCSHRVRSSTNR